MRPIIRPSDRRHTATFSDKDCGAERHVAVVSDTPRHAGFGLRNRRLSIRVAANRIGVTLYSDSLTHDTGRQVATQGA
jgi:hypothetical protein